MNCKPTRMIGNMARKLPRRCLSTRTLANTTLLWLVACGGCATLSQKSPVAENVVSSRQMSMRGLDAMHRGKWDEAEKQFASAVSACPTDERAHQHYAQTLWKRGARTEAIEHIHKAVHLSGNDPALLVEAGKMHLEADQLPLAAQYADSAINGNRNLAAAWALRGEVESRSGRAEDALADFHRALSLDENLPDVHEAVAELYLRGGNASRALATAQAASSKFPEEQVPGQLLRIEGLALKSLGRYDDASKSLALACQRGVADHELLYHLGHARLLAGDPANAQLALSEALKLSPGHAESLQLRASIESASAGMATLQR